MDPDALMNLLTASVELCSSKTIDQYELEAEQVGV
jgi:hypothetical protein